MVNFARNLDSESPLDEGEEDRRLNEMYQRNFKSIARNELLQPEAHRSLLFLARTFGLYVGFLALIAVLPLNLWTLPLHLVLTYLVGLSLVSFQSISHDCGHSAFFKSKMANDIAGTLTGLPLLVSYIAWSDDHKAHHGRTNHIEDDPNKYHMTDDQIKRIQMRFNEPLYFLYFWFYTFMASLQLGLIAVHFLGLPLRKYPTLYWSTERPWRSLMNLVFLAMFVGAVFTLTSGPLLIFGFVVPYFLYHMLFIMLGYFQHNYGDSHYYDSEHYSFMRGVIQSRNLDFGKVNNFFFAGFADTHLEHHLFPTVPLYKLKLVSGQLDEEMRSALASYWPARPVRFYREFYGDYNKNYLLRAQGVSYRKALRLESKKSFFFFFMTGLLFPLVWWSTVAKEKKAAAQQAAQNGSQQNLARE